MKVKKAGCILINVSNRKVGLVYRKNNNDYTFPKGHLEDGETLQECAIRETEEETGRKNHLINEKEVNVLKYVTPSGEDVECYFYIAIDDGETKKEIPTELQEKLVWISAKEVEEKLTYENLKEIWKKSEDIVNNIFNNITTAMLTDIGDCPTCFDKENNNCL